MPHTHETAAAAHRGRLAIVLAITIGVFLLEAVGAAAANSLALLADAGHVLTDVAGLALALTAVWAAGRPANDARTFGYARLEVFAAVANAVLLMAIAVFVLFEAVQRLSEPYVVRSGLMLVVAASGWPPTGCRCCCSVTGSGRASTCAAPTSRCWATSRARWRSSPRPS